MRKSLLLVVSFTAFTLIPAVSAKAGKPVSCGSDVTTLSFTLDSNVLPASPTPTGEVGAVNSDGQGAYANTKKTSLAFQVANCTYDFVMNLSGSSRTIKVVFPTDLHRAPTTGWFFNFDRIASVPVTDPFNPLYTSWCAAGVQKNTDGSLKTYTASDGVTKLPYDNYAPCGSDTFGAFARRSVGFGLANNYDLRYQNTGIDPVGHLGNGTAFIKVYHPNPNQWTLEPDNQAYTFTDYVTPAGYFTNCGVNPAWPCLGEWAAILNSNTTTVGNPIIMPFTMRVTK